MTRGATPFGWLSMLAVLALCSWRLALVLVALASIRVVATSMAFSTKGVLPGPGENETCGAAAEDAEGLKEGAVICDG